MREEVLSAIRSGYWRAGGKVVTSPDTLPASIPSQLTWLCKPLHLVHELQAGDGVSSARAADPCFMPGLQVPGSFDEEADEAGMVKETGGVWAVLNGVPTLQDNIAGLERILAAATAEAKALETHTLGEAKHRPDWLLWEKAIQEELEMLCTAGTWHLEEPPHRANIIGSKWVFKAKKDATGNVIHYKAHLVAQGFSQIDGVDYDDTYAPVAKLASSHTIIAMAN